MYGDAFVGPVAAPVTSRRDTGRTLGVAVFAAILSASAGAVFVSGAANNPWFPKSWDARVAPIAAEVSHLRGLTFEHPVAIHYLEPAAFEKQMMGDGQISAADRAEVTRQEAVFRSLGLLGGKVDLLQAAEQQSSSGTLAYYEPDKQDIIVRGTTLDVEHQVTIAHELTHVLQDQRFDLDKLQQRADDSDSGDSSALKALVEGDAVRIQDAYLKQLPAADQKEYDRENNAEGDRVGKETQSVPDIIDLLSQAPYEFGESTVEVLSEAGGNDEVNSALTGPTPSTEVFTQAGDISVPVAVSPPLLPPDGVAAGKPEVFGPFEMFLTLATRLDPARALAASDAVSGGRAVTFHSAGETCYRVAVATNFEHSRPFLLKAVQDWARGRARTSVDAVGDEVGFSACDPGKAAAVPSSVRFHAAVTLLGLRTGLTVGFSKGHESGDLARCVARVFVLRPGSETLLLQIDNSGPTAAQTAQIRAIAAAAAEDCRADPDSGLQ